MELKKVTPFKGTIFEKKLYIMYIYIYTCQKCAQSIFLTLDTRETLFFERYHGGSAVGRTFLLGQSVKPLVSNNHGAQIFGRLNLSIKKVSLKISVHIFCTLKNVNWI